MYDLVLMRLLIQMGFLVLFHLTHTRHTEAGVTRVILTSSPHTALIKCRPRVGLAGHGACLE